MSALRFDLGGRQAIRRRLFAISSKAHFVEVLILYYWVLILYCDVLILYYWVLIPYYVVLILY